jgi:hypothetical protein
MGSPLLDGNDRTDVKRDCAERQRRAADRVLDESCLSTSRTTHRRNEDMNMGLKNKLLVMAAAAGIAGLGIGCGGSSEAPAAEEGATEATTGDEAAPAPEGEAAPAPEGEAAPAPEAAGGEGSCGEGSCS